ncbi:hypothetical protein KR222_010001, partial [Zaprionus bogoriensis]
MVNFNSGAKMMVTRCIELLNAKIAHAHTRHIARRVPINRVSPRKVDINVLQRERQKTQKYKASKRLSMWEQNEDQANPPESSARLDHVYYKHYGVNERNYDCTWVEFPEQAPSDDLDVLATEKYAPVAKRKNGHRPDTAKPWDAMAMDFIKHWDHRKLKINRNRF